MATAVSGVAAALPHLHVAAADSDGRLEVALIGCGVRGKFLTANLPDSLRVTALCDCSLSQVETVRNPKGRFAKVLARFVSQDASHVSVYQDYREMFRQQKFDAVIIAAPDHHHASAAILAMTHGADVYVEKPLATTIAEGRAIVDVANKLGRVVQVGSQQRTMEINRQACEFIRDGGLGKIAYVEERNFPGPMPYVADDFPAEPQPDDLRWDLFCGPTPRRDYNGKLWIKDAFKFGYLTWRGWDLFDDYSGHLMTNWGAHSVDMIQYALGKDRTGPTKVRLQAGMIDSASDDQWHEKSPPLGTIRDKVTDRMRFCPLTMAYADGTEIRFRPGVRKTVFHGERGKMEVGRNDYHAYPSRLLPPPDTAIQDRWKGDGYVARPHLENWVAAIRTRGVPNAPLETGHRSITVCHLANLARQLKTDLDFDPTEERFEQEAANAFLSRPRRDGYQLTRG